MFFCSLLDKTTEELCFSSKVANLLLAAVCTYRSDLIPTLSLARETTIEYRSHSKSSTMTSATKKDLVSTVVDLIDVVVEIYLSSIIKPFLKIHERVYASMNKFLRGLLDDHKKDIPVWFTANFITYARTVLVFPTILLLAWGHTVLPAALVILVDFGDFLDGVVARYWVDVRKEEAAAAESKDKNKSRSTSPTNSDHDSFGKSIKLLQSIA
jgi:hypothetical protein